MSSTIASPLSLLDQEPTGGAGGGGRGPGGGATAVDGVSHRQTSAHASRSERTSQAGGIGATVRRQGRAECAEAREQKAGRRSEQLLAVYGVTVPDSIAAGCTAAQLTEAEKGGGAAGQSEEGQQDRRKLPEL